PTHYINKIERNKVTIYDNKGFENDFNHVIEESEKKGISYSNTNTWILLDCLEEAFSLGYTQKGHEVVFFHDSTTSVYPQLTESFKEQFGVYLGNVIVTKIDKIQDKKQLEKMHTELMNEFGVGEISFCENIIPSSVDIFVSPTLESRL